MTTTKIEEIIENNVEQLQDYFLTETTSGMMCNKDTVEQAFDYWLATLEPNEIISIIQKKQWESNS